MITTDHSKYFFIIAFIFAGMAFIVVNAYLLVDFFDRPLAKRSEGLKLVSIKWEQFRGTTDSSATDLVESATLENTLDQPEPALRPKDLPTAQPTSPLPVLTGIFQAFDVDKNSEFIAILEGKRLKKHDTIKDFTIDNITVKGVVLVKKEQTWFIPTPSVFFSLSR
jgi:hypothetical protein